MKVEKYDIFLSYRREGGLETAKHLYDSLKGKGYSVFYDIESMRAGQFNEQLYRFIEKCRDFILILPPNGLDRCENEDDWVRQEIEHAKRCNKNIVLVLLKGFDFPKELPKSIEFIRTQQGIAADATYWDAVIGRLQGLMKTPKPVHKTYKLLVSFITVAIAAALIFIANNYFHTYPRNQSQENLVNNLLSYLSNNLTIYDISLQTYRQALDEAQQYIEGNRPTKSATDVRFDLTLYRENLAKYKDKLSTEILDSISGGIDSSPFSSADLINFKPVLESLISTYIDNLIYIRDNIIESETMSDQLKANFMAYYQEAADIDAEINFYCLNELLLPVNKESMLSNLKSEFLPNTNFYDPRIFTWTTDTDIIAGEMSSALNRYETLTMSIATLMAEEESGVTTETLAMLEADAARYRGMGYDTTQMESEIERLRELLSKREELKEAYIEYWEKLVEKLEPYRPLEDDDVDLLWGKGMLFMTLYDKEYTPEYISENAAECFRMYADKTSGTDRLCAENARRFALNAIEMGWEGGVVVCLYEEDLPQQAVELGDIICAVDGVSVPNRAAYFTAIKGEGVHEISIIRFSDTGFDMVDSVFDTSLGRLAVMGLTNDP